MPTYEYACTACGHRLEAVQSFSDEPLTSCPECGGALRKVYGAVGIVLKGSGFYKTDSRAAGSKGNGRKATATESSGSGSDSSGSGSDSSGSGSESSGAGSAAPGKSEPSSSGRGASDKAAASSS